MIELEDQNLKLFQGHSSKGNQLKWKVNDIWYKADYTGYEGLVEYVISELLKKSTLLPSEFVTYEIETIKYKHSIFNGAKSKNFLDEDWDIVTLARLYELKNGRILTSDLWNIQDLEARIRFLVDMVKDLTGISDFGIYLSKLLTIDMLFLNEDRHLHNVAVLVDKSEKYKLCPFFDHGAGLLADTTLDYPLTEDIYTLIPEVKGKTICYDFEEAVEIADRIYGQNIKFYFTKKDVRSLLSKVNIYSEEIVNRVENIIYEQMRKYPYLFMEV